MPMLLIKLCFNFIHMYRLSFGTVYSMGWSLGAELWNVVLEFESNFGVAKILVTPADSDYFTFSIIWTGLF